MKTSKCCLTFAAVAGIVSVSALGQVELLEPSDRSFLIGRPHPVLAGIDKLHFAILPGGAEPNRDGLVWSDLETEVVKTLDVAGVNLAPGIAGSILNVPECRVYADMLRLEEPQQYVFRIQISLARAVQLMGERGPVFKADVWETDPVMRAVSVESVAAEVSAVVLHQVEVFIQAYKAANPAGDESSDANDVSMVPEEQVKPDAESAIVEYEYVASKNSSVFHKPECSSARKIAQKNLVRYSNREEAIKAGKRPCKLCQP